MQADHPLQDSLLSAAPAPDQAGQLALFGRFVGSWDMTVTHIAQDTTTRQLTAVWHFGWVLGGRAVQDVLITHSTERPPAAGSTLRMPDAGTNTWQVCWAGPVSGNFCTLVARPDGAGIRLDGRNYLHDEVLCWRFHDITDVSFRWTGEVSVDSGRTWRREQEMTGRRRR